MRRYSTWQPVPQGKPSAMSALPRVRALRDWPRWLQDARAATDAGLAGQLATWSLAAAPRRRRSRSRGDRLGDDAEARSALVDSAELAPKERCVFGPEIRSPPEGKSGDRHERCGRTGASALTLYPGVGWQAGGPPLGTHSSRCTPGVESVVTTVSGGDDSGRGRGAGGPILHPGS
jgi:hypothetical protein